MKTIFFGGMKLAESWYWGSKYPHKFLSIYFNILFNYNICFWHEVFDNFSYKDEGPFEDETHVFYILQYQKLPRTKNEEG
jgi:hypothetical protein